MTVRQAANQQMFRAAHADARATVSRFGLDYRSAFANALRGFQAVARGYTGDFVRGSDRWS